MAFVPAESLKLEPGEIAMALAPGTFGSHAGIVFRSSADACELTLLHLRWNEMAEACTFPAEGCWVAARLDIGEYSGLAIEELLRDLAASPPIIKYGVGVIQAQGSFSRSGYVKPKGSDGLTCATFVWQLLKYGGLDPVQAESWPEGANADWVISIAQMLADPRRQDIEQAIAVVGAKMVARRIKPTELGVPALHPIEDWPMHYETVVVEEPTVVGVLNQCCPTPA